MERMLNVVREKIATLEVELKSALSEGDVKKVTELELKLEVLSDTYEEIWMESPEYKKLHDEWVDEQVDHAYNDIVTMADLY